MTCQKNGLLSAGNATGLIQSWFVAANVSAFWLLKLASLAQNVRLVFGTKMTSEQGKQSCGL
jgi:hypothetical protein